MLNENKSWQAYGYPVFNFKEMKYKSYQHIEKFGTEEVDDINLGTCYIFPKLDGTNSSLWSDDGVIQAGSRKRELSEHSDNHGFFNEMINDQRIVKFFIVHPYLRLFGEFLVPHTLKTYRDDTWRRFWIIDVIDESSEYPVYLPYETYKPLLDEFELDYIPPIAIIRNPTYDRLIDLLEKNTFLIKDGHGVGEGIVIKNYEFINKYGRITWAKIVRSEFKDEFHKKMGCGETEEKSLVEEEIANNHLTGAMVDKVIANIRNENDGWRSEYIPRLLGTVFHDLITEEIWSVLKKYKNPKIDFNMLNRFVILRIKALKPELF